MTFPIGSSVTGNAQSGLTTPTYTMAADSPPANNAKQFIVTALGGTQTGVTPHSVSNPFTSAMWRPLSFKTLEPVNPVTGKLSNVPTNVFKHITRKGVLPLVGQALRPMVITTIFEVPAGADIADPNSVAAAISLHFGIGTVYGFDIGQVPKSGTL